MLVHGGLRRLVSPKHRILDESQKISGLALTGNKITRDHGETGLEFSLLSFIGAVIKKYTGRDQ